MIIKRVKLAGIFLASRSLQINGASLLPSTSEPIWCMILCSPGRNALSVRALKI